MGKQDIKILSFLLMEYQGSGKILEIFFEIIVRIKKINKYGPVFKVFHVNRVEGAAKVSSTEFLWKILKKKTQMVTGLHTFLEKCIHNIYNPNNKHIIQAFSPKQLLMWRAETPQAEDSEMQVTLFSRSGSQYSSSTQQHWSCDSSPPQLQS